MSIYKGNTSGTPTWRSMKGTTSARINHKRHHLVKKGRASLWMPLRTLEGAIDAAGI